jgi:hypothetical protein
MFRWIAYVLLATGLISVGFGFVGIGMLIFGAEDQRANAFGGIVLSFGTAFANGLFGGGLLLVTRSDHQ